MKRRTFIANTAAAAAGAMVRLARLWACSTLPTRPNIIYIFTDQQIATMMSCAGNTY